jgi:hypothetical protein
VYIYSLRAVPLGARHLTNLTDTWFTPLTQNRSRTDVTYSRHREPLTLPAYRAWFVTL